MKPFLMSIRAVALLLSLCWGSHLHATPDWHKTTKEEFLGSNGQVYAVLRTVIDNQGSYYSSREIKTFYEFSKSDDTRLNQELISDIVYNIDADHLDPNTPPKVTKVIKSMNQKLLFSVLTTNYRKPPTPLHKPEWLSRLTWEKSGLSFDKKLTLLSVDEFAHKDIVYEQVRKLTPSEAIIKVLRDHHCYYLSFQLSGDFEEDNYLLRLSPDNSKLIDDWVSKIDNYRLISTHPSLQSAQAQCKTLDKLTKENEKFSLNLEIWSAPSKTSELKYYVVHRPFEAPMDQHKITQLDTAIRIKTKNVKSEDFIERWFPYTPPAKSPNEEPDELEPEEK